MKKIKCSCLSEPDYHRDDCLYYDVHGKPKINKSKVGTVIHAGSLEDIYFKVQEQYPDHIILMIYGISYEILEKNGKGHGMIAARLFNIKPHQKNPSDPTSLIRTTFDELSLQNNLDKLVDKNYKYVVLGKCDEATDIIPLFEYGRKVIEIKS